MSTFQTSETWSLIIAAVLGVLVQKAVLTGEQAQVIQQLALGLVGYAIGRIVHKTANARVPFTPAK